MITSDHITCLPQQVVINLKRVVSIFILLDELKTGCVFTDISYIVVGGNIQRHDITKLSIRVHENCRNLKIYDFIHTNFLMYACHLITSR